MNIASYKVSTRLGIAFGMILVLMVGLVIVAWNGMRQIEGNLEKIVNENIYKMTLVQDMSESVHIVSRVMRTIILLQENASIEAEYKKIEAARAKYNASVELLEKTQASETGKAIRAKMREARLAARPLNDQVVDLARRNLDAEATEMLMEQAGPATQKWQDTLDENIELQKKQNLADEEDSKASYRSAMTLLFSLGGMAIVLAITGAIVITRSLTRQLGGEPAEVGEIASRIANGDLTADIVTRPGDTASVMHAMKQMQGSLVRIVAEVRHGTDTIATASSQIAAGNQDLSSRTEQQASSLEETASSMEELTSTVKQNADNARQANQLAGTASEVAANGGQVVSQVVETMQSINQASGKIADIISVIDGIAFQTNILALNAAVEAARAGEQGRGFAVVATEVRNLAQRSAAAAKEIKELIDDSVEKVASGTKLVDAAGTTMNEVVGSVRRVTDVMAEIQAASQEQSAGIEQVNQAIGQMDQVTQQNAALVEQAAAAAESLQDQAAKLSQVVSVFKVSGLASVTQPAATKQKAVAMQRPPVKASRTIAPRPASATPKLAGKPSVTAEGDWEEF